LEAKTILKRIYIAPDFGARSGVSAYARNFFSHVLQPEGFELLRVESLEQFEEWRSAQSVACRYHLEIAVGTHLERKILWRLLETDAIVDITLHDPPYIAFPYYRTESRWLNQLSKLVQVLLPQHLFGLAQARGIRNIFTLSEKGRALTARAYRGARVRTLPHVSALQPMTGPSEPLSLIYTGFIGKKKGLDYALQLHQALRGEFPDLIFKVVGAPMDPVTKRYFAGLQEKYWDHVEYLGYVDDQHFIKLLSAGHVVLLPTLDYGTICPVSGNILNALMLGSVVVSTPANANAELIEDGCNGRFLSDDLALDVAMVAELLRDPALRERMIAEAQSRLARDHSPQKIRSLLRA
jgi:glycosyltransferase involved in cell wall biosynthesis